MSDFTESKGKRIYAQKGVHKEKDNPGWYSVVGDNGTYQVKVTREGVTCDCAFMSLHGHQGKICSHIVAVIFLIMGDKETGGLNGDKRSNPLE
jgi:hypothetical protein